MICLPYKGPEIPCLRIIGKCININTAVSRGSTKVRDPITGIASGTPVTILTAQ
ncbi:hypothetical protein PVAP13_5NG178662 [Panicum virgatum]|uniref:Uncharacterized protein n=1 Tax=Panicum virgatum TaxID=38727 RepID=A0A8T0RNL2_PANVG|nr:hypothetical protein PVAP13_5NG178662 [Panicum virgatum]